MRLRTLPLLALALVAPLRAQSPTAQVAIQAIRARQVLQILYRGEYIELVPKLVGAARGGEELLVGCTPAPSWQRKNRAAWMTYSLAEIHSARLTGTQIQGPAPKGKPHLWSFTRVYAELTY